MGVSSTMSQSADLGVDVVSLLLTVIYAALFVCEGHQLVCAYYSKNKLYTYRNGIMLVLFCSALLRWLVWGKVTLLDAFYVDNTLMMVLYFLPVWLNFCAISLLCVFYAYAMFDGFYGAWPWLVTVAINVAFMALNVTIAVLLDYSDARAPLVYQFYIAYALVLDTSTALVLAYFGYHFHRLSRANTRRLHWFLSLPKSPQTFTATNLLIVVCFLLRSLLVGLLSSHLLASRDDNAVQFNRRRNATDEADGGSDDGDAYRTSWTVMLFYLVSEVVPNCAMLYLLYLPAPRAKATASVSSGGSGGGRRGGWVALCNWLAVVSSRRGSRDADFDFDGDSDGDSDEDEDDDETRALEKRILPPSQQRSDSDDGAWDSADEDGDLDDADLDDEEARIAYALQYQPSGPLKTAQTSSPAASWWWPFTSKGDAAPPGGRRRSNSAKFFYYFDQGQLRKQLLTPTKRRAPQKRRGGRQSRPRDAPRGSLISDRLGAAAPPSSSLGPASPPSGDDEDAPDVFMRRGLLRSHEQSPPPLAGAESPSRPAATRPPVADGGWWSSWSRHLFGSGDGVAPPPRRPRSSRPASRKSGTPGLPDAAGRERFDADDDEDADAAFREVPTTSVDEDHSIRVIYEDPPPPRPRFGARHGGQFSGHVNMAALQAAHSSEAAAEPRVAPPQTSSTPGVASSSGSGSGSGSSFGGVDAFAGASTLHAPQPRASTASIPLRRPSSTNLVATAASSQTSSSQASGLRSTPQTPSAMPLVRQQLPQTPEPGYGAYPESAAGSATTQALYDAYSQLTPHQLLQLQQREYLQHQQQQMQLYYQSLSRTATPSLPPQIGAPLSTPSTQSTSAKRVSAATPPADG